MIHRLLRTLAFCLALSPATAWAHGVHHGLIGVVHVLTSPVHLGLALSGLIMAGFGWRWTRSLSRRGGRDTGA
jgi:hypothetical protein